MTSEIWFPLTGSPVWPPLVVCHMFLMLWFSGPLCRSKIGPSVFHVWFIIKCRTLGGVLPACRLLVPDTGSSRVHLKCGSFVNLSHLAKQHATTFQVNLVHMLLQWTVLHMDGIKRCSEHYFAVYSQSAVIWSGLTNLKEILGENIFRLYVDWAYTNRGSGASHFLFTQNPNLTE